MRIVFPHFVTRRREKGQDHFVSGVVFLNCFYQGSTLFELPQRSTMEPNDVIFWIKSLLQVRKHICSPCYKKTCLFMKRRRNFQNNLRHKEKKIVDKKHVVNVLKRNGREFSLACGSDLFKKKPKTRKLPTEGWEFCMM